ncbi:MAG: NUDIX hydrolase [Candidatus Yanofskybacteria bacterium]|nr:NUDIX hydrolase [Candidatus Yanofskybacteria bacterium]
MPGGSSPVSADPLETIVDETLEEVGLKIDKSRFVPVISRQLAATMSAHHGMLYSVELNDDELAWLKSQKDIPHGSDYPDNPTGERAYTEVVKLKDIRYNNLVDWGNMGMILSVLSQEGEKQ